MSSGTLGNAELSVLVIGLGHWSLVIPWRDEYREEVGSEGKDEEDSVYWNGGSGHKQSAKYYDLCADIEEPY